MTSRGGSSNQHELNGSAALKGLLGTAGKITGRIRWHYFSDDQGTCRVDDQFTWYDARERGRARTRRSPEWRLYYFGQFLRRAAPGDMLILAQPKEVSADDPPTLLGLIFPSGSSVARQATALFGLDQSVTDLRPMSSDELAGRPLELFRSGLVKEIGIEPVVLTNPADTKLVLGRFGPTFPSTGAMSKFARENADAVGLDADDTLLRWIERETELYYSLEEAIISHRIARRFTSVAEFIEYTKTVRNTRSSRMGHSLENQLAAVFQLRRIRFERNVRTEGGNRPDFLFPGAAAYRDDTFPESKLLMLAAKSTCKDRWRQVLAEADRIKTKHLCTLEEGISLAQTTEMARQHLRLVVPKRIHESYREEQRRHLMTLEAFIAEVEACQS